MSTYLKLPGVIRHIQRAIKQRKAFSLVRIGDGENIVLAQKSVWPLKKVLKEPWAVKARRGQKGIILPNMKARNEIVAAIRKATIVGILPRNDRMIKAPPYLKRRLTDQVFQYYGLKPKLVCNATVNRIIARKHLFLKLFKGKRLLIINRKPTLIKSILSRLPYNLTVTATIPFSNYKQIKSTLQKAAAMKDSYDIVLISCGVNAVILAPKIAKLTGKIAIDFGKAPKYVK